MQNTINEVIPNYKKIKDNDIYVMNPLFRLRNECDFIKLYGLDGICNYEPHHTVGIVLALFDGKRTVRDIAVIAIPFLEEPQADNALKEAIIRVKCIVSYFLKTTQEQQGKKAAPTDLPSEAALIPLSLLPEFGRCRCPDYNPMSFLPKHAYKRGNNDPSLKERVPSRINWHLTSACSVNCRYCYLKRRNIPNSKLIPFKRMLEIIEECKKIGVFEIAPGGGDVLLYPYLYDFLNAINESGFLPIRLSTKAYLSKEMAKRLAEYNIIWEIQFSIDSTSEEVADYLTRTPGFYRRTMASIDNALEAGLPVTAKAVITPYNILTIPRLYRELRQKGVQKMIRLAMYSRSGFHHSDDLFNHTETYKWLENQVESLRKEFPHDFINLQNGEPTTKPLSKKKKEESFQNRAYCTAGRASMMICSDGKVIPCEQMPEIEEIFCGDLKKQSVQEVWYSIKLENMTTHPPREKFKGTPCYDCEEFDQCIPPKGYCIRDTFLFFGSVYTTPDNCPKSKHPFIRIV